MTTDIAWRPTPDFINATNWGAFCRAAGVADFDAVFARAEADPTWFWSAVIDFLDIRFFQPYEQLLDLSQGLPHPRWCVGGKTNFVLNALDRYLPDRAQTQALVWASEDGRILTWTYAELDRETNRLAAGLKSLGLCQGDVVAIYLPMVPETYISMLAIAKLGCIAMPLFSGFGAEAVATRLSDSNAVAVVTVDGARRRGQVLGMKEVVDKAVQSSPCVRHVIVADYDLIDWNRSARDVTWRELLNRKEEHVATAVVDASHPLLLMYTSGTSGRPKGVVHTHAGFTIKMAVDTQLMWDLRSSDRILHMADFGWLAGPMLVAATTLSGACHVIAEGVPDYPQRARLLRLVEDHAVTFLGVAPTTARSMRGQLDAKAAKYDLSSIRLVTCSGEPLDSETWLWLFRRLCGSSRPIVNFSGGTEVGGILYANIVKPMKPAAFNGAFPSLGADVVNEFGESVAAGELGELVMRGPCLGRIDQLWHDPARYLETYWDRGPAMWRHHDLASRDADGHWYIHGRSDDTIKVAGKRTGPAELEAVLLGSGLVSEAAVIGVPDPRTGSALVCAVIAAQGTETGDALRERLSQILVSHMGASFRPKRIVFVSDLPRTRNMKIMRRLVRAALLGEPGGDLSALANPETLVELERVSEMPNIPIRRPA